MACVNRARVGLSSSNDRDSRSRGAPSPPEALPSEGGRRISGEEAIAEIPFAYELCAKCDLPGTVVPVRCRFTDWEVCRGYGPYAVCGAMPVAWHQKNDANAPGVAAQSVHAWRMRSISSALAQPCSWPAATSSGLPRIEYM